MSEEDVWLIDGTLPAIDFDGYADDRSPGELANRVIERFSTPGDWVLDPFAGLGTTLFSAAGLGRNAIGFEPNPPRAAYVSARLEAPHRLLPCRAEDAPLEDLPDVALIFTSPPYITVELKDDPWGPTYFADMEAIFARLARLVAPGGHIVVEVSNVRTDAGFRPLAAEFGASLRKVLRQTAEIARVNTGKWPAGPGTMHSSILVFTP